MSNYSWIVPGLAQGAYPGSAENAFAKHDIVLLMAEEHQPAWRAPPGKLLFKFPLDDDGYNQVPLEVGRFLIQIGRMVAKHHAAGRSILSTCHEGRNRSGLVTALALILGYGKMPPNRAIALIQARRPTALTNPMFVQFLQNYRAYT